MLTRRGGLVLGVAIALGLLGRLLGLVDLYVLGAAAALAVGLAAAYVHLTPFSLEIHRRIRPNRLQLGAEGRIELELANNSERAIPTLMAEEPFGTTGAVARLAVPALGSGQSGRAVYRVPTDRRGRFDVGPLTLTLEDPLGLASSTRLAAEAGSVVVYPHVDPLPGMPPAPGYDPNAGMVQRSGRSQGEDFFALRPYEVGDDLRRVHWPSTARTEELMIRQVELPWQHRTTIVLDVRRPVHDAESFERAVSAAASILTGSQRGGAVTRLVTTAGLDSGFNSGRDHWEAMMAGLAAVQMTSTASLASALSSQRRHGDGSSVAVITTTAAGAADTSAIARLGQRVGLITLVVIERSGESPLASRSALRAPYPSQANLRVLDVSDRRPLPVAWASDPVLSPRRPMAAWRP